MDQDVARLDERVKRLEQWRETRDRERDAFRVNWSDADVTKLRTMLNGYIAAATIKAFWASTMGRVVILSGVLLEVTGVGLAVLSFLGVHPH